LFVATLLNFGPENLRNTAFDEYFSYETISRIPHISQAHALTMDSVFSVACAIAGGHAGCSLSNLLLSKTAAAAK